MLSKATIPTYHRPAYRVLAQRLAEPRRFIQVVTGPRQVGKTTLVRQVLAELDLPAHYASADDPGLRDSTWLATQWQVGRVRASAGVGVLALDEIQKVPHWSETLKRLWDEDSHAARQLHVIVLGSAPLAVEHGLSESLAGRFEIIHLPHWSYAEMRQAFGWDLETFIRFGGYPGAAALIGDVDRWRSYMLDALIETTLSRDLLLLTRIDKPALLRQLFRLGMDYSAQVLSYQKLVGQLQDAGNTVTIAHYLRLLQGVGLLAGLEKFAGSRLRQRNSSPKLLALDPGLLTAMSVGSADPDAKDLDRGRVVETAIGAHLVNTADRSIDVTWWRAGDREVDFVVSRGDRTLAIEVASGRRSHVLHGLEAFRRAVPGSTSLLIGAQGLSIEQAMSVDAGDLLGG